MDVDNEPDDIRACKFYLFEEADLSHEGHYDDMFKNLRQAVKDGILNQDITNKYLQQIVVKTEIKKTYMKV